MLKCEELPVKGVYYYSASQANENHQLFPSQALTLMAEPDNAFDRFAVQVWLNPPNILLLGYVPRTHSQKIAYLLARNKIRRVTLSRAQEYYQRLWLDMSIEYEFSWRTRIQYWVFRFFNETRVLK